MLRQQALAVALKRKWKYTECTKYETHNKSTLETLKKSRKVYLEDWALETGERTTINKVWEKVPRIYDTFVKKFARVRETRGFLNKLYRWPLVEAYVLGHEKSSVFTFAICHRRSVCLSVVCNVRAPYSDDWNSRQYFYGIWYLGHPLTSR